MKNSSLLIILTLCFFESEAQETRQYFLNKYFEVTQEQKEAFFIRLAQPYNEYWVYTDYDSKERVVRTGYYTDSTFTTPIGPHSFSWEGQLLYKGRYVDGKPSGYWYFYNKKGEIYDSLHYYESETSKTNLALNKTSQEEKNKSKELKEEHLKKDTSVTFTSVDIEATFPGGDKAWAKHISQKLSLPDLIMALNRPQKMTVEIQFIVCKDGEICSVEALNSSSPLLDIMAVNAIRKGPRWQPASQNGRNVKAWRRQKISFIIPE